MMRRVWYRDDFGLEILVWIRGKEVVLFCDEEKWSVERQMKAPVNTEAN